MLAKIITFDIPFAVLALLYPLLRHQVTCHVLNCFLKCLPMVFLIGVLLLQQRTKLANSYTGNILLGLFFSTVGDAFLVWTDVWFDAFLGGIVAFGIAHLYFIGAFGLRPFKVSGAAIVVTLQVVAFFILRQSLMEMGILYLGIVPVYGTLLVSMAWRASAEGGCEGKNSPGLRKLGGLCFVASDVILSLTEVTGIVSEKLMSHQMSTVMILATYYLAQYCFAKSALQEVLSSKHPSKASSMCNSNSKIQSKSHKERQ